MRVASALLGLALTLLGCGAATPGSRDRPGRPAVDGSPAPPSASVARLPSASSVPPGPSSVAPPAGVPSLHSGLDPFGSPWTRRRVVTHECQPAHVNLERAAAAIVTAQTQSKPAQQRWPRWDRKRTPAFLARMVQRFALTRAERKLLYRNRFVVPARLEVDSYAAAYHEIYRSQLPVYVSVDAVLHAAYRGTDTVLGDIEQAHLFPLTVSVVDRLRAALPGAAGEYPPEVALDLDVYLTVAGSLLHDELRQSELGTDRQVSQLFQRAQAGRELREVQLFGRRRMIDFSQLQPRGRYAKRGLWGDESLQPYFRGAMWLARLEFNLVSRSSRSSAPGIVPDPRETPREALAAFALADLAQRAQVLPDISRLNAAWLAMAGGREDVSLPELVRLRQQSRVSSLGDPQAFTRLKAAIGNSFQRQTRMHWMPQGASTLPAIATLLGPRTVPDATALTGLVHDQLPGRLLVRAADVAYLLGHDGARRYLAADCNRYPGLQRRLDAGRTTLARPWPGLYGAWLGALRALAVPADDRAPSFMRTRAFEDARLSSLVAGYAQLRKNHMLVAAQTYDAAGCEIPDGFVEPAPDVYQALGEYAERGRVLAASFGHAPGEEYFARLKWVLRVLEALALDELAGRPLSKEARNWFSMVAEILDGGCDAPPAYNGWYFVMYPRGDEALRDPALVADFYTSTNLGLVVGAGARRPRIGLFVVDAGGGPRVVAGPVAGGYEVVQPIDQRGATPSGQLRAVVREPWARSYVAPAAAAPKIAVQTITIGSAQDGREEYWLAVRGVTSVGTLTVELLDQHRSPVGAATAPANGSAGLLRVSTDEALAPEAGMVGGLRVRAGSFSKEILGSSSYLSFTLGGALPIDQPELERVEQQVEAERSRAH